MCLKQLALASTITFSLLGHTAHVAAQNVRTKIITRLFWQDRETQKLSYADLTAANQWGLKRGWVANLPAVDAQSQQLAAMQQISGTVLLGVKGTADARGGWMAFDSGVFEEAHGNHFHWRYSRSPTARRSELATESDSAGRIHLADKAFYLPQSRGGIRRLQIGDLQPASTAASVVFAKEGRYSSLAVVNANVCYAASAESDDESTGQIDVVDLRPTTTSIRNSLKIPGGRVGSVAANGGKVFFTNISGMFWTVADTGEDSRPQSSESATVLPIALSDNDTDENLILSETVVEGDGVLCVATGSQSTRLCLINAASTPPSVSSIAIDVADGLQLARPVTVLSLGKRFAFLFQERLDPASEVQEQLTIVELDPNRDRSFADATVRTTIPVGASRRDGPNGHHGIAFDAYGRYAVFTNPGDGVLTLMSLQDLRVRASFRVGGSPDNIIAVGASEHFH